MYIDKKYLPLIAQEALDKGFVCFSKNYDFYGFFVKMDAVRLKHFPNFYAKYIKHYNLDETKFLRILNAR